MREILHHEGAEALAQVAQRSCGCPIAGRVQGQVGRGFEHPGLVEAVPAHGRGLDWTALEGPFQPKPLCDPTIMQGLPKTTCSGEHWKFPLTCNRSIITKCFFCCSSVRSCWTAQDLPVPLSADSSARPFQPASLLPPLHLFSSPPPAFTQHPPRPPSSPVLTCSSHTFFPKLRRCGSKESPGARPTRQHGFPHRCCLHNPVTNWERQLQAGVLALLTMRSVPPQMPTCYSSGTLRASLPPIPLTLATSLPTVR